MGKPHGIERLLNAPVEPQDQWKLVARVNSLRDMLVEFIAIQTLKNGGEIELDLPEFGEEDALKIIEATKIYKKKQRDLEKEYCELILSTREESFKKKASNTKYRNFDE